jgi:hypothetical protein
MHTTPESPPSSTLSSPEPSTSLKVPGYEVIEAVEIAKRWKVPTSWVRSQCRSRVEDPIPHARVGRYVRFCWGSPALAAWWGRRLRGAWSE